MKHSMLVWICAAGLLVPAVHAGLFKNSVDVADLAEVPGHSLHQLQESEFEVFLAEVGLNAAKAAERRAAAGVKAANRILEAEKLDRKAAQAEIKAAKANQDQERMTAAAAHVTGAEEDLQAARALLRWKEQEQATRQAEVAAAKAELELAEANRDLARVRLLKEHNAPSAAKYAIGELERSVANRLKEYDAATRKARDRAVRMEKLKSDWDELAKNLEFLVLEE